MSWRQRTPKVQAPGLSVDVAPFKCPASCQLPVASVTYQEALGEVVHLWECTECHQLLEWITWSLHMAVLFLLHVSGESLSLMASSAPLCS